MKNTVLFILLLLTLQSKAQQNTWKEYQRFYELVPLILHPAEYGDLKPVKDSAVLLQDAAHRWKASAIPSEYPAAAMKKGLEDLDRLCNELVTGIRDQLPDEKIGILAVKVHNKFHYISGKLMR